MKKLFNGFAWSAICALGLFSCTEKEFVDIPEEDVNYEVKVDYDAIKPTTFINVPVKDGYVTVVKQGNKTLLETRDAMTLEVLNPQYSIFTRATTPEVEFEYHLDDSSWNEATLPSGSTMYKTIMFEDRRTASDYDYNDLIIHVQQRRVGNRLRLYIHPIALGNHDKISLGADILAIDANKKGTKCAEIIFSTNVREDLFPHAGEKEFVNTYHFDTYDNGNGDLIQLPTYFVEPVRITEFNNSGVKMTHTKKHWIEIDPAVMGENAFGINWFIINNERSPEVKFYAVPAIKENLTWRDQNGYPYGIISAYTRITNWPLSDDDLAGHDWINYARENVHIKDVYKDFDLWLAGEANANWDEPEKNNSINAIGYIRGIDDLPEGSKALFDIHACFESYPEYKGENIWNNGNPSEKIGRAHV